MKSSRILIYLLLAVTALLVGYGIWRRPTVAPEPKPIAKKSSTTEVATAAPPSTNHSSGIRSKSRVPKSGRHLLTRADGTNRPATKPGEEKPPADPYQVEAAYRNSTDVMKKFDAIDELIDLGNAPALQTIARIFQAEKSPELQIELIDAVRFFEGENQYKMQIFGSGIRSNYPLEIRQAAIDGLIDLDDKAAIPILRGLLNDPNEEIRDAAHDAIEFLQG
jgi:HEAT repeat protein